VFRARQIPTQAASKPWRFPWPASGGARRLRFHLDPSRVGADFPTPAGDVAPQEPALLPSTATCSSFSKVATYADWGARSVGT
jgi:hypothetical protein